MFDIAALVFGASRDFGAFLISMLALPGLLVCSLAFSLWAIWRRPKQGLLALALTALAPAMYFAANRYSDRVLYLAWASSHRPMLEASKVNDAIIADWRQWGMAGSENDSYLASNPDDTIGNLDAADAWRRKIGVPCEIVASERMEQAVYILTTYECPIVWSRSHQ